MSGKASGLPNPDTNFDISAPLLLLQWEREHTPKLLRCLLLSAHDRGFDPLPSVWRGLRITCFRGRTPLIYSMSGSLPTPPEMASWGSHPCTVLPGLLEHSPENLWWGLLVSWLIRLPPGLSALKAEPGPLHLLNEDETSRTYNLHGESVCKQVPTRSTLYPDCTCHTQAVAGFGCTNLGSISATKST